jgi:hypothetical protein
MLGYFGTAITNFTVEYHVIARKVARFEMQRGFLEAQLVRQAVPSRQVMLTSGEYMGLNGGGNTTPSCGPDMHVAIHPRQWPSPVCKADHGVVIGRLR